MSVHNKTVQVYTSTMTGSRFVKNVLFPIVTGSRFVKNILFLITKIDRIKNGNEK